MTQHWDEFSKSLAEKSVPRRQSLRLLGAALAGAFLGLLGAGTAWAGRPDPCKSFCRCRNKKQQNACLAACNACNKDISRLCGSCGSYFCCGSGQACCDDYCADLGSDMFNCGACGYVCDEPGPLKDGACFGGRCVYACVEGAVECDGGCTLLEWDSDNCGACGNVCPESAPYCNQGACSECSPGMARCGDSCVNLASDPDNCGTCGNVCGGSTPYCSQGTCTDCGGFGVAFCDGVCVNILSDNGNCGACGVECASHENCTFGICYGAG